MESHNKKPKKKTNFGQLLFDYKSTTSYFTSMPVSMFWTEKLYILVFTVQLFSLINETGRLVLPIRWREKYAESKINLLSGDFTANISLKNLIPSNLRVIYASFWISIGISLIILGAALNYLKIGFKFRLGLLKKYFVCMDLLYLPVCLAILPSSLCQYDNCQIDFSQVSISLLSLIVVIFYLIGYPLYIVIEVRKFFFVENEDYEEHIYSKELEYILRISDDWLKEKMYIFSSFRGTKLRVYHRAVRLGIVFSLVLLNSVIKTSKTKLLIFFIIFLAYAGYCLVFPVYRCFSSSFLYFLCITSMAMNVFLFYYKAIGGKGQYMVDSNLTQIIALANSFAAVLISMVLFSYFITRLKWPLTADKVKMLAISYRYLLTDFRVCSKMVKKLVRMNNFMFVRADKIDKMLEIMHQHFHLLNSEGHALQFTAIDLIDNLFKYRIQVVQETLLPSKVLEDNLDTVVEVVNRRWNEQILMNPVKRRLLLKIGALKMFFARFSPQPFTSGDQDCYLNSKNLYIEVADETMITFELNEIPDINNEKYAISTSRQIKDIRHAAERKNAKKLIEITERIIEFDGFDDIDTIIELKDAWEIVGREKMPLSLYEKVFNTSISRRNRYIN